MDIHVFKEVKFCIKLDNRHMQVMKQIPQHYNNGRNQYINYVLVSVSFNEKRCQEAQKKYKGKEKFKIKKVAVPWIKHPAVMQ